MSFVKKHYTSAHIHIPIDSKHNMHAKNSRFYNLHGDDSVIIFKNVHLETSFQMFAFSGLQNTIVM